MVLAPVPDVHLCERTFELAEYQHISFLIREDIWALFLLTVSVEPHPELILILLGLRVWCSPDAAVIRVVGELENLGVDVELVSLLVWGKVGPNARL